MKPVFQTKLHDPGKVSGNCLAAGVASILEIDIDQVPAFEDMRATVWFGWMVCWLDGRGWTCDHLEPEDFDQIGEGEIVLAAGNSPRSYPARRATGLRRSGLTGRSTFMHLVVYRDGQMIHDPHPSDAGLDGDPTRIYLIRRK